MNLAIENLNSWAAAAARFAWPMLWQSSLLILVLLLLDFALRRRLRAAVRYALWLVVLVKLVLPPSLALPTSLAWWVRPPLPAAPTPQSAPATIAHPTDIVPYRGSLAAAEMPVLARTLAFAVPPPVPEVPRLTPAAWLLGGCGATSLVLLAWMLMRWHQVVSDARRALPPPDWLHELFRQARQQARLRHPIGLGLTSQSSSPAVCGLFRPRVLLPRALADQMARPQLRAVLLHELIHLRRRDLWVNCAQALLQIAYWWHPLLWLANARIRRAREEAVDDAVMLTLNADAHVYAPTLLEVAKLAFRRPLASLGLVGILESRHALRHRIERLVNLPTPQRAGLTVLSLLGIMAFTVVALPQGQAPAKPKAKPSGSSSSGSSASQSPTNTPSLEVSSLTGAAGSMEYDLTTGLTRGSNGVMVKYGSVVLTADRVTVNERTGELIADGSVRLQLDQQSLAAEHLRFNFKSCTVEALTSAAPSSSNGAPAQRKPDNANEGSTRAAPNANLARPPADKLEDYRFASLLQEGRMLFEMGKYDEAEAKLRLVLRGDPQNQTAHYYLLLIKEARYGNRIIEALPAHASVPSESKLQTNGFSKIFYSNARQDIARKLDSIHLDTVKFENLPLKNVIEVLNEESKKHDPDKRGIKFVLPSNPVPSSEAVDIGSVKVTLVQPLTNVSLWVSLGDVLKEIVKVAEKPPGTSGITYSIEEYAVCFSWRGPASKGRGAILSKLNSIRLDHISFDGLSLGEVVRILGEEIKKRDPEKRGINLFLNPALPSGAPDTATFSPDGRQIVTTDNTGATRVWDLPAQSAPAEPADISRIPIRISPALTDVTPADVLDAIVKVAASPIQYSIEDYAVVISWRGQQTTPLYVRVFMVDPATFVQGLERVTGTAIGNGGGTQRGDLFGQQEDARGWGAQGLIRTNTTGAVSACLREYFSTLGVDFTAPGRNVFWSDRQGRLMVRGTMDELDLIEQAIQHLNVSPETPTAPSAPSNTHTNAGATDRTTKLNGPMTADISKNPSAIPASSSASLRPSAPSESARESQKQGSSAANYTPSIGRFAGSVSPAPSSVMADIFGNRNFSLSAKLDIDITIISMSETDAQAFWAEFPRTNSPGDTTRSVVLDHSAAEGQVARCKSNPKASILYSTSFATKTWKQTRLGLDSTFPDDLSITPQVSLDASMVRMTIVPSLIEFLGYDDPGKSGLQTDGPLPHFRVRKVTSSATVGDGQTLIFGTSRILRTSVAQELKENVPLGDLPILSGLFNQGTELLILLTPRIDPSDRP